MKLYNQEKSNNEILEFVTNHYNELKSNKKNRFNVTLNLFSKNNYILDYGCGWGAYAKELSEMGNKVEAIDISQNEIEISKFVWGENDNRKFRNASILEYKDKEFDIVLSCQVIEHVHNVGNYLNEINRVLKDNGKLIISTPNILNPRFALPMVSKNYPNNIKNKSSEMLDKYNKMNHHINSWDPIHFVILMASMGFELVKYIPNEGIPFPKLKFVGYYWRGWLSRLFFFKNFCYTMIFEFKKAKNVKVSNID